MMALVLGSFWYVCEGSRYHCSSFCDPKTSGPTVQCPDQLSAVCFVCIDASAGLLSFAKTAALLVFCGLLGRDVLRLHV